MTLSDIQIKSTDNQTLAHTVLTITVADYDGFTLDSFTDTEHCSTTDNLTITCSFGNLEALGQRTVSVLIDVTSDFVFAGQPATLISAKVTTNNENGTNQQLFTANSGPFPNVDPNLPPDPGFQVGAHSDDGLQTFVPPGQLKELFTSPAASGNVLSTDVVFTSGAHETVSITEGLTTPSLYPCPTTPVVLHCQDSFSAVVTDSGFFQSSPYFHWKLTALVLKTYSLSQGFVAHFDTETHSDWTLLFKSKSSFCGSLEITANGRCIKTLSLTKFDKTYNQLVVEVVMIHQGGMKY